MVGGGWVFLFLGGEEGGGGSGSVFILVIEEMGEQKEGPGSVCVCARACAY